MKLLENSRDSKAESSEVVYIPLVPRSYTHSDLGIMLQRNTCKRFNQTLTVHLNSSHMHFAKCVSIMKGERKNISASDFICREWFVYADKVIFNHNGKSCILKERDNVSQISEQFAEKLLK